MSTPTTKCCSTCQQEQSTSRFSTRKASKDGLAYVCKTCDATKRKATYLKRRDAELAYRKARRIEKPVQVAAELKDWTKRNKEKKAAMDRAWREANGERLSVTKKAYREKHHGRYLAYFKAYKAMKASRVPPWADRAAMAAVYTRAVELRRTGLDVEVDHVIPLNGKTVSGLHVETNLQIIPSALNRAKSNSFEVHV